jgi:hypothetical protein
LDPENNVTLRASQQQYSASNQTWSLYFMSNDWKTYRTRFVVHAKQLTEPLTFTDTRGRQHHGTPGDYVVQTSDGPRISRREIFEDVYVTLERESATATPSVDQVPALFGPLNLPV